ncbi:hypothetical protein [Martelella radicis]|uniref:Uncharacterized protein n=1 Tax=Martelella radicis TaxID=1397476 RepID=A0A7W6P9A8_9HYPH|nr:hypothetical protein [Martelella radicis]MBB4120207.1 hypothetical protein [Martelella radicis]
MAKMYALKKIILPNDTTIDRKSVFDATPALAKQLLSMNSARNATKGEITAAEAKAKEKAGNSFGSVTEGDATMVAADIMPVADKVKA